MLHTIHLSVFLFFQHGIVIYFLSTQCNEMEVTMRVNWKLWNGPTRCEIPIEKKIYEREVQPVLWLF